MESRGFQVRLAGRRPGPLPPRRRSRWLAQHQPTDNALLECVREHDRALVRYQRGPVQPARLIAQVAHAWPRKRIIVWVTRIADGRRLAKQLAKLDVEAEVYHANRRLDKVAHVAISTYSSLGEGVIEVEKRPLVFVLNPAELMRNKWGLEALQHARKARMYGFLPRDVRLAPSDRDRVLALFGPRHVEISRHGQTAAAVQVVFIRIRGGEPLGKDLGVLQLKRRGIWHHAVRNRRIAALAKALAENDRKTLNSRFVDVARAVEAAEASEGLDLGSARVGLLVENVEHGIALSERLPGWPLVTGPNVTLDNLSETQRDVLQRSLGEPGGHRHLLMTSEGRQRVRKLDVLIRADGGVDYAGHTGDDCIDRNGISPCIVLDFSDKHHPALQERAQGRKRQYLSQGSQVVGEAAPGSPLKQFLASRPKVEWP